MIRFFNPGLQYLKHKKEFDEAFVRTATNGDLILREDVEIFESKLADFIGTKYAIGVNSGTDALTLCLKWAKIGPGDEVIVPSRTFVATAEVVVNLGATPVYMDMDNDYESLVTEKTKAIMPVHIEGAIEIDMEALSTFAKERGIFLIEDACQALGASQDGKKAGSIGDAGCFSFYPAKILGAFGDAGGITTDNYELYHYAKEARNHFKDTHEGWGINSRLDNLQAALLNVKVPHLPEMLERREEIAGMYDVFIDGCTLPKRIPGRVYQDYIIRTERRDELFDFLKAEGVETLKNNYPFPNSIKLPLAQAYEDETLRLPCNDVITPAEAKIVIDKVNAFFKK